jgi:hypothetical protein
MKNGEELKVGDAAPAFEAIAVGGEYGEGQNVTLRDFAAGLLFFIFIQKTTHLAARCRPAASVIRGAACATKRKSLA